MKSQIEQRDLQPNLQNGYAVSGHLCTKGCRGKCVALGLRSLGLKSSWLKNLGLKSQGLESSYIVEKSGVERSEVEAWG